MALDSRGKEVDPPMEIQVLVEDENDSPPMCDKEESVFELQENEPAGKKQDGASKHLGLLETALENQLQSGEQHTDHTKYSCIHSSVRATFKSSFEVITL